jgi:phage gp36-like protein
MSYSTQNDVQIAVGGFSNLRELADLEQTFATDGGAGIATVVAAAIRAADGYINGYLKQRHAVPLAVVPAEINDMSAAWAARILRRQCFKVQPLISDTDAEKADRLYLKGIADGTIQLGVEPTPAKSSLVVDKAAPRDSALEVSRNRLRDLI